MSLVVVVLVVVEQSIAVVVHVLLVLLDLDLDCVNGSPEHALHSLQAPYVTTASSHVVATVQQSLQTSSDPEPDVLQGLPDGQVLVCV